MMRCSQCKTAWKTVDMYNHETKSIGQACITCLNNRFRAIMTLANIDFEKIEEEVNGSV